MLISQRFWQNTLSCRGYFLQSTLGHAPQVDSQLQLESLLETAGITRVERLTAASHEVSHFVS